MDQSEVPAEGYALYPADTNLTSSTTLLPASLPTTMTTGLQVSNCVDVATNCYSLLHLCDNNLYVGEI